MIVAKFVSVPALVLITSLILAPITFARLQDTATTKATKAAKGAPTQATQAADSAGAAVAGKPSQADIDSAKSSGKVWVNTDSGVYHKSGQYYGNTKHGKFMSEQDAQKSGYRAAKNEK